MNILVVGAGVVGLAIGRALALRGHEIVVAERSDAFGTGISSRNSEVIHAGLYYPAQSLRAIHCVRGRKLLYEFCASRGVDHRACGKLVVATTAAEIAKVVAIRDQGEKNGVEDISLLDAEEARRLEPSLACVAALYSGSTGIVDSHGLMMALLGEIEDHSGMLALGTPVERIARASAGWVAHFGGREPGIYSCDAIVNAASFGAQALAHATEDYPSTHVPPLVLARGNYFGCLGRPAFSRLIYPAPVEGGLGIHLTLDLAGRMRFGPDVEWIDSLDYRVNSERGAAFYLAIRRYWPDLPDGALVPDYAGIRPKLSGPGEAAQDFVIDGPAEHGLRGLVHLFGIESPGLTASLSIAEDVADRLEA